MPEIEHMKHNRRKDDKMKVKDWFTPHTLITLIAIVIIIAKYQFTVDAHAKQLEKQATKITIVEKDTIVLKTEVPKIQEDIKEVKDSVLVIQTDIKLVLRALSKINNNQ